MPVYTETPIIKKNNMIETVGVLPTRLGDQILSYDIASNAILTAYTVPADFVLLLHNASCHVVTTAATVGYGYVVIRDVGANFIHSLLYYRGNILSPFNAIHHFDPPIELIEGDYFQLRSSVAAISVYLSFHGTLIPNDVVF